MTELEKQLEEMRHEAYQLKCENLTLKGYLCEAGNELCYKCGQYQREHLGACDGCRWQHVKSGEMPT